VTLVCRLRPDLRKPKQIIAIKHRTIRLDAPITMNMIGIAAAVSVGVGSSTRVTVTPDGIDIFKVASFSISRLMFTDVRDCAILCDSVGVPWTGFDWTTVSNLNPTRIPFTKRRRRVLSVYGIT
jgi:hypothetical protein